jgi:vitamin K-dependent gamma-carboxylase
MEFRRIGPLAGTVEARLAAPVDGAWLVALRVLYGAILSASMWRFVAYGWIDRFFVEPSFHFKYWGLGWVGVLPGPLMHALFWALGVLALCVALGLCFRLCAFSFVLGFGYLQAIDVTTYLNHYYLALLLGSLLTLSPAGRFGSVDAWWRRRRARAGREPMFVATAWLYLLRFQVAVVYVCAGLAKLDQDWLVSAQPLGIWLASLEDKPLLGYVLRQPWAPFVFSWAGFLFDSSIVLWLSLRRTRPYAYVLLLVFHVLTAALFPIGMFPVIMSVAALVFFEPSWPRALAAHLRRKRDASSPGANANALAAAPRVRVSRVVLGLAVAYCLLQALLPLRFLLYPGNVRWHEQGMRFAWRVMVREKNASVTFRVTSANGRAYEVSPARYLTPLQEREMAGQPDLILQLAHHLRDDFAQKGLGSVAVYADVWCSLNGRRARRLIDPGVDLAAIDPGLERAAWILPAPSEPAPSPRRRQTSRFALL